MYGCAKWSTKEYHYVDKNGKNRVKKEHHFGFKAHILCDVQTELPLAYTQLFLNNENITIHIDFSIKKLYDDSASTST